MNGRPDDRRGYISQPWERSPARNVRRRRSRSRGRDHRRRAASPFVPPHLRSVDKARNGPDEAKGMFMRSGDVGPYERGMMDADRSSRSLPVMPPDDCVREGIVFEYDNYFEFLKTWLETSNAILLRVNSSAQPKRVEDNVTPTTLAEKSRIILPAGLFNRDDLLHCDMVIKGLPPSVFFGSGFGHRPSFARDAAAKDLVDKCCRVGLITEALHASIGNHPYFNKADLPKEDYNLAIDAIIELDKRMCEAPWPWDIYSAREVEQDVLDRLKIVFDSVMQTIYLRNQQPSEPPRIWNGPMKTNGLSPLPSEIKKTEFCRHCNLRGHNEKECRKYGENTRNGTSVPGKAFESWKTDRRYERGRRTDQYHPYWDGNRNAAVQQPEYTPDELASKIAKQREELLLREVALRNTAIGEAPLPSRATYSKSNASHRVRSPSVIEIRDTPDREEEELRARLAAETLRMEEELRLKEKEKELERRLQQEFEEKKRAMEEEIRKQVQLEERAKLQMELAQQRTFPPPMQQYPPLVPPQYPSSTMPPTNFSSYGDGGYDRENYANYDRETGGGDYARDPGTSSYSSVPDFELEEIKRLIKETEDKLLDLQRNAREAELSVIFQSRAFQTVSELGDSAYMLDRSQKQHLLRELKELLSHAGPKEKEIQSRERSRGHSRSAEKSRRRSSYRHHDRSPARRSSRSPRRRSSYRHSKKEDEYKEVRHQVGGITLRNLNPVERRHLKIGDIVVAQDSGTAKWTTAHIAKISGDTATLSIGNATWKKPIRDLFKEVNEWSL